MIVKVCSFRKGIDSHSKFRPVLEQTGRVFRIQHQKGRSVAHVRQLRFVSCHTEQLYWASQLKELITPFDTTTWFLNLTLCFIMSCIVKLYDKSFNNSSLFYVKYSMFMSILDQSNGTLINVSKPGKTLLFWCVLFVPLI